MDGVSAGEDGHAFWKFSEITHIFHWKKLIEDRIKPNFFLPCWRVPPIVSISKFSYPIFFCTKSCGKFGNLGQRSPFQFFHSSFGHCQFLPSPVEIHSDIVDIHSGKRLFILQLYFDVNFDICYYILGRCLFWKMQFVGPKILKKKPKEFGIRGKIGY